MAELAGVGLRHAQMVADMLRRALVDTSSIQNSMRCTACPEAHVVRADNMSFAMSCWPWRWPSNLGSGKRKARAWQQKKNEAAQIAA